MFGTIAAIIAILYGPSSGPRNTDRCDSPALDSLRAGSHFRCYKRCGVIKDVARAAKPRVTSRRAQRAGERS